MPKCKHCHSNITKFDKERCPICGGLNPLDGQTSETTDVTQLIETMPEEKKNELNIKQKSKKVASFLLMFLGAFSADEFYLGFIISGIIRIFINILFVAGIFTALYLLKIIIGQNALLYSALIAVGSLFLVYIVLGIISLFKTDRKDKNGVLLK
ncbi:MAG: NINE protein [Bacilli bacterium]|nr:NINE protein [Bacilli bacterium]